MNEFDFNNDRDKKIEFIKKIAIITVVFIIVFLVVRACNNIFINKTMEDIKNETKATIEKRQEETIDLNKPFNYYNITTNAKLHSFLRLIGKNLVPESLSKYINYENEIGFSINGYNWNAKENLYKVLDILKSRAYENILEQLLDNKVNYSEAPLTEHFKEKFKNGLLCDYDSYGLTSYDFNKRYFVLTKYNGEARDYYYYNFILDYEGYLDDIILDKIVPMYDEEGIYIPKKDSKLMDNEENIKLIISQVLLSEASYYFEGDIDYDEKKSPQSRYNRFKEFGLTDRFREYYASVSEKGITEEEIDSDEGDTINIIDINIQNKTAVAKLVFHKINIIKYYDISWTTDNEYRLDTIDVKFNREEIKKSVENNEELEIDMIENKKSGFYVSKKGLKYYYFGVNEKNKIVSPMEVDDKYKKYFSRKLYSNSDGYIEKNYFLLDYYGHTYYFDNEGLMVKNAWIKIDDETNSNKNINDIYYKGELYFNRSGYLTKEKCIENGEEKYISKDGKKMKMTNCIVIE